MKLDKVLLNDVSFRSITFLFKHKKYMLVQGWSLTKGDWWYRDNPENKKFLDVEKYDSNTTITYGIYIGRLGLCLIKDK